MPTGTETKYRLTQAQLRALTVDHRPALTADGKTVLVKNKGGKPYRFSDGTPRAPAGFNIYVGPKGAFYEVRARIGKKAVRISLGSVQELTLTRAHDLAAEHRASIRQTGEDPRQLIRDVEAAREAKGITIGDAMQAYIDHLADLVERDKGKPGGLAGVKDSLARLERPEVGLARLPIAAATDEQVLEGWNNLRHSAMLRSNRLTPEVKSKLARHREWWKLSRADLVSKLRLSGKAVELAHAAGMAAAEHTMSDARRAVERVLARERKLAARSDRQPVLFHNPFDVLGETARFRSSKELRKHYEAARVRNPLGVDDAETGQKSLPSVLKSLLARRDMQNGWNATAVDYVLLTLLWGTRRNEGARLRWYDSCSKDELALQLVSWAWIAPKPDAKNPTTGLRGSQVFLHDTKSGEFQLLPVAYFAERVLRWRLDAKKQTEKELLREVERGKKEAAKVRAETADIIKRARAQALHERAQWRLDNTQRWVFPARNPKAKEGYYSDSKSLLMTVRKDAGLLNVANEIDIGLTTHDFRRTMGRFAAKLLPGHVVSQLLLARAWPEIGKRWFAITDWVRDDYKGRRQIIVQAGPDATLTAAYISALINIAVPEIISPRLPDDESGRFIGFVFDEMSSIGKIQFAPLVDKGRSKGVVVVACVQDLAQLCDIYGDNQVKALTSMVGTQIICKVGMGETREQLSKLMGTNKQASLNYKEGAVVHTDGAPVVYPHQLTGELGPVRTKQPPGFAIRAIVQQEDDLLLLDFPGQPMKVRRRGQVEAQWLSQRGGVERPRAPSAQAGQGGRALDPQELDRIRRQLDMPFQP